MRVRRKAIALVALVALVAGVAALWLKDFSSRPLALPRTPYEFAVKPGTSLRALARQLAGDGLLADPQAFWVLGRILDQDKAIQAGIYRLEGPLTPRQLLDKLSRGEVFLVDITFIEGTTLRQWLAQLKGHARVRPTLGAKPADELRASLGIAESSPEGWLFPDTYRFAPGTTDVEILRRAHAAMKRRLAEAWAQRSADLPLATPYEALVLASIVEKETGAAAERDLIASALANRLRRGMRLQADPTVIYGMGESFDGNIRKKDLSADTPWNTYTRDGLPPTPIAMPGGAALKAATRPAETQYLYFVGKGDGTHHFSRTLEEHNRAVAKYQLGK
jgi:UPF0755 protein